MDKINIITFVSLTQPCTIQTSASYQVSDIKIYDPSAMKSPTTNHTINKTTFRIWEKFIIV